MFVFFLLGMLWKMTPTVGFKSGGGFKRKISGRDDSFVFLNTVEREPNDDTGKPSIKSSHRAFRSYSHRNLVGGVKPTA